jgi:ATP-dependent Clp protease ATP-binding subunit ClpC
MDKNDISGVNPDALPLNKAAVDLLAQARNESARLRHSYIGTEHVALALLGESDSVTSNVFSEVGLDRDETRRTFANMIPAGTGAPTSFPKPPYPYTDRTRIAFALAADFAREIGQSQIGPEHVLVGMMRERMNAGAQILHHHGVTEEAVIAAIRRAYVR